MAYSWSGTQSNVLGLPTDPESAPFLKHNFKFFLFSSVGTMLRHVTNAALFEPAPEPRGELLEFDQNEFFGGNAPDSSMADVGYIFVPDRCRDGLAECRYGTVYCLFRFFT